VEEKRVCATGVAKEVTAAGLTGTGAARMLRDMRGRWQKGFAWLGLAAVLLASNLHLAVIQGVAWVRMYEHYRVGYSPMVALEVTLSGQAPCNLCKFVQAAQKEQKTFDGLLTWTAKVLLPLVAMTLFVQAPARSSRRWVGPVRRLVSWCAPPEFPPPRWA